MHHGDSFALDVLKERYLRLGTENQGSPEFTEVLKLYKDCVYGANIASDAKTSADIASAAKTTARQCFGGTLRRNDRNRDSGGSNHRENSRHARPGREAVAPRSTFAKDVTEGFGKSKAKAEPPTAYKAEGWGAPPRRP
eukprot:jgi/Tetstr1/455212/TSEL_042061.t1